MAHDLVSLVDAGSELGGASAVNRDNASSVGSFCIVEVLSRNREVGGSTVS